MPILLCLVGGALAPKIFVGVHGMHPKKAGRFHLPPTIGRTEERDVKMMPVLWMTISLLVAIDGELLVNPSFEAWREGLPIGWQRYGGGVPQSRVEMAKEAHSGQWAVRLVDEGPEESDERWSIGLQQDVPIQPGHWYEASVWAKAISRNHPEACLLYTSDAADE